MFNKDKHLKCSRFIKRFLNRIWIHLQDKLSVEILIAKLSVSHNISGHLVDEWERKFIDIPIIIWSGNQ